MFTDLVPLRAKADDGYSPAEKKEGTTTIVKQLAEKKESQTTIINPTVTTEIKKEKAEVNITSSRSL